MMGNAIKNIMFRAINKRLTAGETLDEIFKSYPRLTETEIAELRALFNITETT